MKKSGIYQIQNLINGKIYVGSSIDLNKRQSAHFRLLKNNNHHSKKLQNAWNKYGENNFKFSIIAFKENNDLIKYEQYYINTYDSVENGYNILPNAKGNIGLIKTHCKYGHEFTKKNTYISPIGNRRCIYCKSLNSKQRYLKLCLNPIINKNKNSCKRGHEINSENTSIEKTGSYRCKICKNEACKQRKLKNKVLRTHCKSGLHEWIKENIHIRIDGRLRCKPCHYLSSKICLNRKRRSKCSKI